MQRGNFSKTRSLFSALLVSFTSSAFLIAGASGARAQEIEPSDFVAAPAGTNVLLYYHFYGHDTEYKVRNGPNVKNSGLEVNTDLAIYGHFFSILGHPVLLQVKQPFGSLSGGTVGGVSLGSTYGAGNTAVSASFWPYSNPAKRTHVAIVGALNMPDGSYSSQARLNLGDNRVSGFIQLGLSKGVTDRFAFDLAFDSTFYGNNNNALPGGQKLSQSPTNRGQLWLNYAWTPTFTTSVGYEGLWGGREQTNGTFNGNATFEQRVRAAGSYFVTPSVQAVLDVNHDVAHSGNFKQEFGATLRLLYLF